MDTATGTIVADIFAKGPVSHVIAYSAGGDAVLRPRQSIDELPSPDTDMFSIRDGDTLEITGAIPGPLPPVIESYRNSAAELALSADGLTGLAQPSGYSHYFSSIDMQTLSVRSKFELYGTGGETSLALSRTGKTLAIGSYFTIQLCDVQAATCSGKVRAFPATVSAIALTSDDQYLVAGIHSTSNGSDHTLTREQLEAEEYHKIKIFDVPSLTKRGEINIKLLAGNYFAVHPKLPLLAVAAVDRVLLIDIRTATVVQTIVEGSRSMMAVTVAFSLRGDCLAAGFAKRIAIYCIKT
ncbi:hypothetical protein D3874_22080 [Oleomonas cavernae]|uniref:Uncharacterized protein n=2 Tax=Oleomonas cavernae TaxID=2320859 RepID=A0A418WHG5_9PROT|nr:hypothetical protein D3874_22080 [Oleomonas cavernae]